MYKKKPLFCFWYYRQSSHLSLSLTQQIYCDTLVAWKNKYDHNVRCNGICHSYPLHPIFLKFQSEFQKSYMNLKSIHISILKWKVYTFIFWIFLFEYESSYLNSEYYYFNLKTNFHLNKLLYEFDYFFI
jgi:hypothetical protein